MQRNLIGRREGRDKIFYNYSSSILVTRLDVAMTITSSPAGMMGQFSSMVIDDIFVTQEFLITEQGVYDLLFYCTTNNHSGTVVFRLNGQEIIGSVDLYSPVPNVTIRTVEGIVINGCRKIALHGKLETKDPSSLGYETIIGDIWWQKRE